VSTSAYDQADERNYSGLVAIGYITAVVIPFIGFVLGIVVATRPSVAARHGARIIVISIVVFAIALYAIVHNAQNSANQAVQSFNQQLQQNEQTLTQQECQADPQLSFCSP
jgi:uncharacterized membrane protein YeiB